MSDLSESEYLDTVRLDALADPKFVFSFSITASGRCHTTRPIHGDYLDLRTAIDYARCAAGHIPNCVKCNKPVQTKDVSLRWYCTHCKTSFYTG